MTEPLTKTEAVGKIVNLAKEVSIKDPINWKLLKVTEDEIYEMMAASVLDQMYTLPEDHREAVSMATLTKLLVENFVLNIKLEEERSKNAASTDSN